MLLIVFWVVAVCGLLCGFVCLPRLLIDGCMITACCVEFGCGGWFCYLVNSVVNLRILFIFCCLFRWCAVLLV